VVTGQPEDEPDDLDLPGVPGDEALPLDFFAVHHFDVLMDRVPVRGGSPEPLALFGHQRAPGRDPPAESPDLLVAALAPHGVGDPPPERVPVDLPLGHTHQLDAPVAQGLDVEAHVDRVEPAEAVLVVTQDQPHAAPGTVVQEPLESLPPLDVVGGDPFVHVLLGDGVAVPGRVGDDLGPLPLDAVFLFQGAHAVVGDGPHGLPVWGRLRLHASSPTAASLSVRT
jgi:hypothetical protein